MIWAVEHRCCGYQSISRSLYHWSTANLLHSWWRRLSHFTGDLDVFIPVYSGNPGHPGNRSPKNDLKLAMASRRGALSGNISLVATFSVMSSCLCHPGNGRLHGWVTELQHPLSLVACDNLDPDKPVHVMMLSNQDIFGRPRLLDPRQSLSSHFLAVPKTVRNDAVL